MRTGFVSGVLSLWMLLWISSTAQSSMAAEGPSWSKEPTAKALESAKALGKPVFLYWGAVWCPPCNAMKAEVFVRPEFMAAIQPMVAIMIDGDSTDAQKWSDYFHVSGYPTMLVLGADGEERLRFYGYTPLPTILAALSTLDASSATIASLVQKALRGEPLGDQEWRQLSYSDWSKLSEADLGGKLPVELALDLSHKIPAKFAVEKSLLASYVILNGESAPAEVGKKIRAAFADLFAALTASDATLIHSQVTILEGHGVLKWIGEGDVIVVAAKPGEIVANQKTARAQTWMAAVERLGKLMDDSLSARVGVLAAKANLSRFEPTDAERTKRYRQELEVLQKEMSSVKDSHLQIALVPTLADAFEAIGEHTTALKLLERTAAKSTAPWYFYSHAAWLIRESGDMEGAIPLYEKAMRSAKGPATKIQWTNSYVQAVAKSQIKDRSIRLEKGLVDLFKLALAAPDGFYGRNIRSLNKARDLVSREPATTKKFAAEIVSLHKKCDGLKEVERVKACTGFFEPLMKDLTKPIPEHQTPPKAG